jgi:hypothetical protein
LSKSAEKAKGCPRFFLGAYLSKDPAVTSAGELAETGTDFHRYRQEYIDHLVRTKQESDPGWMEDRLGQMGVTDDALDMIRWDLLKLKIDPRTVWGTEIWLSVDSNFNPLQMKLGVTPGTRPDDHRVFAHGGIDLLSVQGDNAVVDDYKTGWANQTREYEAIHYAVLVFAHFPDLYEVTVNWDYTRAGAVKPMVFSRLDLDWMQNRVRNAHAKVSDIVLKGDDSVNPTAGLCGFCPLACPVKAAVANGVVDMPSIQNENDAAAVAGMMLVAKAVTAEAEKRLRAYLDKAEKVELDSGKIVAMRPTTINEYPLDKVLEVLEKGTWGIPPDKLTVGATKLHSYAKAKKRAGMREELDKIATRKVTHKLAVFEPKPELEGGSE